MEREEKELGDQRKSRRVWKKREKGGGREKGVETGREKGGGRERKWRENRGKRARRDGEWEMRVWIRDR